MTNELSVVQGIAAIKSGELFMQQHKYDEGRWTYECCGKWIPWDDPDKSPSPDYCTDCYTIKAMISVTGESWDEKVRPLHWKNGYLINSYDDVKKLKPKVEMSNVRHETIAQLKGSEYTDAYHRHGRMKWHTKDLNKIFKKYDTEKNRRNYCFRSSRWSFSGENNLIHDINNSISDYMCEIKQDHLDLLEKTGLLKDFTSRIMMTVANKTNRLESAVGEIAQKLNAAGHCLSF